MTGTSNHPSIQVMDDHDSVLKQPWWRLGTLHFKKPPHGGLTSTMISWFYNNHWQNGGSTSPNGSLTINRLTKNTTLTKRVSLIMCVVVKPPFSIMFFIHHEPNIFTQTTKNTMGIYIYIYIHIIIYLYIYIYIHHSWLLFKHPKNNLFRCQAQTNHGVLVKVFTPLQAGGKRSEDSGKHLEFNEQTCEFKLV